MLWKFLTVIFGRFMWKGMFTWCSLLFDQIVSEICLYSHVIRLLDLHCEDPHGSGDGYDTQKTHTKDRIIVLIYSWLPLLVIIGTVSIYVIKCILMILAMPGRMVWKSRKSYPRRCGRRSYPRRQRRLPTRHTILCCCLICGGARPWRPPGRPPLSSPGTARPCPRPRQPLSETG